MNNNKIVLGHHGTSLANFNNIKKDNFNESAGKNHWYGPGAYFFIDGINAISTAELARLWSIDQSWDNNKSKYSYTDYVVIEASVNVDENAFLDLTDNRGIQIFNQFRNSVINKILEGGKRLKRGYYYDNDVISVLKKRLGIKVVKGNVYIMFAESRRSLIPSRIPNCTIMCVDNCKEYVIKDSIKEVLQGTVL